MNTEGLYFMMLAIIILLLFQIAWDTRKIEKRTKERFPTEKEADDDWARKDPMGHWEAHRKETSSKGKG
jgi:hypothetical protein